MPKKRPLRAHPPLPLPAGLPNIHPLLALAVSHAFETLQVAVALRDDLQWHAIHTPPQPLLGIELDYDKQRERQVHNNRCSDEAKRKRTTIVGSHGGFSDFFVPVITGNRVASLLIAGPIASRRPTSAELLERWYRLTGRRGHPSDPEFVRYIAITLDVLLLEGEQFNRFRRMLECLALLCAADGDAHALGAEASELRARLEQARFADHAWEAARSMVDARSERTWTSPHRLNELRQVGLVQPPDQVLVALCGRSRAGTDGVSAILARDAFQRACVDLAKQTGNAVCGRIGDQGAMFIVGAGKAPARTRALLVHLGEKAAALARKDYGFAVHSGVCAAHSESSVSTRYEEALGAAESALASGAALVSATPGLRPTMAPLRALREEMANLSMERPTALAASFDRYIEAVCIQCGYRFEAVRAHLDAGLERAVQGLRRAGLIDERALGDMQDELDGSARLAASLDELTRSYRHGVSTLVDAAEHPTRAAQERNLRRARAFIDRHFTERIELTEVARVAGFAPRHFTRLFKRAESMTFETYVRKRRVERAVELLDGTDLSVERVGELAGFAVRSHFHKVFLGIVGVTPAAFRARRRGSREYR